MPSKRIPRQPVNPKRQLTGYRYLLVTIDTRLVDRDYRPHRAAVIKLAPNTTDTATSVHASRLIHKTGDNRATPTNAWSTPGIAVVNT